MELLVSLFGIITISLLILIFRPKENDCVPLLLDKYIGLEKDGVHLYKNRRGQYVVIKFNGPNESDEFFDDARMAIRTFEKECKCFLS